MNILITGGTGFIGQRVVAARLAQNDNVFCLTRDPDKAKAIWGDKVQAVASLDQLKDEVIDTVINLAGEPIADKRWSKEQKQRIYDSRVQLTKSLVAWIEQLEVKPGLLISGSAIGFYGSSLSDKALDEGSDWIDGFTHQLCDDWEQVARSAESLGIRVVLLRTGVVLNKEGGALKKMLPPFRLGLGGPIASGKQYFSWIHMDDYIAAVNRLIEDEQLTGAFNMTAPEAVNNAEFSRALGKALHRPAFFPLPPFVVGLMLGEGAELLVEGQNVYPKHLLDSGFTFSYPELEAALADIFDS